jgi:hypothetical protein
VCRRELFLDGLRRGHRVALDGPGASLAGEVHGGSRQRAADTSSRNPARARTQVTPRRSRRSCPPSCPTRRRGGCPAAGVDSARLDRASADRLTVEVRHEAAGRVRLRVTAVGLLTQPTSAILDRASVGHSERPVMPFCQASCSAWISLHRPRHAAQMAAGAWPST